MDIDIYQNALVELGAIGQNFNVALQTAADFFTQGFNSFGETTTGAEATTQVDGTSSRIGAEIDASLATSSAGTDDSNGGGLGIGLENAININL